MSTWLDHMHREAIALAIPGWTWHEGDQASITCGIDPGSTMDDRDFYASITVERPGENLKMDRCLNGTEAAEFFNDLMEQGSQRWTSVFARYQQEYEETHPSLDAALQFLHDGWYTAERSPLAVKDPNGEIVMGREQIAADRKAREGATS
ncbi:hypothetical protein [Nonomuraea sp. NPDC001023]|uniref:hypothetical protein n=1 Tax=unclassified Nonomuraea TaxID=2593643 RepID=UPI0033310ACC